MGPSSLTRVLLLGGGCWAKGEAALWDRHVLNGPRVGQQRLGMAVPGTAMLSKCRLSQAPFLPVPPHPSCSCSGFFSLLLDSFLRGILLFPGCSCLY